MQGFIKSNSGTITIMAAALLPFIIGLLALSVDYGMWLYQKRKIQAVADIALVAALKAIKDGNTANALTYASNDASLNGFVSSGLASISVTTPPNSGPYMGQSNAVQVSVSQATNGYFSTYFLATPPTLTAQATGFINSSKACLITLGSSNGIKFSCNGAIKMPNCGIYVNSNACDSIATDKNCGITASSVSTVGDLSGSNITAPPRYF